MPGVHDVLVVGASVAGATTAIHLAERGLRVLLIDRARFPRRKACGEGLFPRGVAELKALGALDRLTPAPAALKTIRFQLDGIEAEAPLSLAREVALGVQRNVLDEALASRAVEAGVELRTGVRARRLVQESAGRFDGVETDAGRLEARTIVAADGLRSALRREAGLDRSSRGRRYGVSAHVLLDHDPLPRVDVIFRRSHEVYLTPVGGRLVNVALLLNAAVMREFGGDLRGAYRARLEGAVEYGFELVDEPLAAGPFPAASRRAWRRNLALAGDAAGFFDGISGDGMSLALVGARLCADAIAGYLASGSAAPFAAYDRGLRRLRRNSTLLARLTLLQASRPSMARRALRTMARHPATFARLVSVNTGELGLGSLRPRDWLALCLGV